MRKLIKLREWAHQYALDRSINQKKISKKQISSSYKSIGIVYDATDAIHIDQVRKFEKKLAQKGFKVKVLAFFEDKLPHENFAHKNFSLNDLNWFSHPKSDLVDTFIAQPFDILINLYQEINFPIEYIAAHSISSLKIGPYTKRYYCYDVMMHSKYNKTLENLITLIDKFLNKITLPIYEESVLY